MPAYCAVLGCKSRGGTKRANIKFFRIPSEIHYKYRTDINELSIKRRKAWLDALHRQDFTENKIKNATICSRHFIQGHPAPLEAKNHADWVPSVNMGYNNSGISIKRSHYQRPDIGGGNNSDWDISPNVAYVTNISFKKSSHYDSKLEEDHPELVSPLDMGCTSFKRSPQNYNSDELELEDHPDLVSSSDIIGCTSNIIKRSPSIDQFQD